MITIFSVILTIISYTATGYTEGDCPKPNNYMFTIHKEIAFEGNCFQCAKTEAHNDSLKMWLPNPPAGDTYDVIINVEIKDSVEVVE